MQLRPLRKTDFDAISKLVEQPGVSHFLVDSPSLGRERLSLWFERSDRAFAMGGTGLFAICVSEKVIGFSGLLILDPRRPDDQYLLYVIDDGHRGKGLATEASKRVVEHARANGVKKVVATIDQANAASIRVMEKLGFRDRGLVAGEHGDLRLFSLDLI